MVDLWIVKAVFSLAARGPMGYVDIRARLLGITRITCNSVGKVLKVLIPMCEHLG